MRLAVGEGFIADLISQPLQSFILRYPGIELEVRMAGANEGVALVRKTPSTWPWSTPRSRTANWTCTSTPASPST